MMKKVFSTLALAAIMALPAAAQIKLGVMAGTNTTKLSIPTSISAAQLHAKQAAGWFVGPKVYATIPVIGLGADVALLYNQRKAITSLSTTGASVTNQTLRSLALPINVRYSIGLSSLAAVYVATGPQFDINFGNKDWSTALHNTKFLREKTAEVSWNVGVGVRALSHLDVGVAYNFGIGQTAKIINDITGIQTKASTRTNSFSLQVAYIF